jgi:hypothetical protein
MKNNRKRIDEVLDDSGNIMDKTSLGPENHRNNITVSNQITDYNIMVGRQKFDTNFLGRFGFHFYESKNTDEKGIIDKLAELEFEQYKNWVDYFVENFSKDNLKKWVNLSKKNFDELSDEDKKTDYNNALKVIDVLKKHNKDKKEKETITEVKDIVEKDTDKDILPKFNKLMDVVKTKEQGIELLSQMVKSLNDKGLLNKDLNEILEYLEK